MEKSRGFDPGRGARMGLAPILPALAALFMSGDLATAKTIRVPGEAATIQAGIDMAESGDEVLVAPGRYKGPGNKDLFVQMKDIAVRSEGGAEVTVIDCEGSGRAFVVVGVLAPRAVIEGFTMENGDGAGGTTRGGGAMLIEGGSPVVRSCVFTRNAAGGTFSEGGGGGIACYSSRCLIEECTFIDNSARFLGGGLAAHQSVAEVRRCRFLENRAGDVQFGQGGGMYARLDGSSPPLLLEDCEFVSNEVTEWGGGAQIEGSTIISCIFANNRAVMAGGLAAVGSVVEDCIVLNNVATDMAGGLSARSQSRVSSCVIAHNSAATGPGGVWVESSTIERCTILDNVAGLQSGGIYASYVDPYPTVVMQCTIARNTAPTGSGLGFYEPFDSVVYQIEKLIVIDGRGEGPAVHCGGNASVVIRCSDVYGNEGGDWVGCIAGYAGINGNISADPLFCIPGGDGALCAESPCAPEATGGCGLIGARGVGCSCPAAVEAATWGRIKHLGLLPR